MSIQNQIRLLPTLISVISARNLTQVLKQAGGGGGRNLLFYLNSRKIYLNSQKKFCHISKRGTLSLFFNIFTSLIAKIEILFARYFNLICLTANQQILPLSLLNKYYSPFIKILTSIRNHFFNCSNATILSITLICLFINYHRIIYVNLWINKFLLR